MHGKILACAAAAGDRSLIVERAVSAAVFEKSMSQLILYSTSHCTLCEQALELLFQVPRVAGLDLKVVDIANDDSLLERYGEKIPVLKMHSRELLAPFDAEDIAQFLLQT